MTNKLLFFSLILFSTLSFSQEQKSFTLEEAVEFALDSNYTSINARREIAKAIKQKWETTAQGLPQIDGSIGYNNNLKQPEPLFQASLQVVSQAAICRLPLELNKMRMLLQP